MVPGDSEEVLLLSLNFWNSYIQTDEAQLPLRIYSASSPASALQSGTKINIQVFQKAHNMYLVSEILIITIAQMDA